jgi:hypothetical protein
MDQPPLHRRGPLASRVSSRVLWTIVLAATVLTFVIGQVAKASSPDAPSAATAQAELTVPTITSPPPRE